MNKFLLIVTAIILNATLGFSQTCGNDSVVTTSYLKNDFGSITYTITVDSFDLTNGIVYNSFRDMINNFPGNPVRSQSYFTRKLLSYNSNQDTVEYREVQGNGSGYNDVNKTEFTYDPGFQPLTKIKSIWNGSSWSIAKSETWTYNVGGQILNYLVSDSIGNISQQIYFYSGGRQDSVMMQNYIGGIWINVDKFLISYLPTGNRDSLFIQKWVPLLNLWTDSFETGYDQLTFLAEIKQFSSIDTITYVIDTLYNILDYSRISVPYDVNEFRHWEYFHGHLKITSDRNSSGAGDVEETFTYDTLGILINQAHSSMSSFGSYSSSSSYDSLGNPIQTSSSVYTNNSNISITTNYTYANASQISLSVAPVNCYLGRTCQGQSYPALALVSGGCGPYTINWSPSTGLSDSTIIDPIITLHDSLNYTITVSDSTGQSSTINYVAQPDFLLSITFDSTLCSGCPVLLQTTPSYIYNQWYRNDTLIPGAEYSDYVATTSGRYFVKAFHFCEMTSDTVEIAVSEFTRLQGHLYLDLDSDCVFNNSDLNMSRYGTSPLLIKLERLPYSVIASVDSFGNYDLPIDTGNFRISLLNQSNIFSYACPDSGVIHTYVSRYGDTITGLDLALKNSFDCSKLHVITSADRFSPCNNTNITVTYFNEGNLIENNPVVNLRLPVELINVTSTEPFTSLPDNVYQFNLPALPVTGFRSFQVNADVICDPTELANATLCIDADISPVNFCSYDSVGTWDGSYIRVTQSCINDSACFRINNFAGTGNDMISPSQWRLYADNLLLQQGTFQLLSGADTTLCFENDGRTYRLEADQGIDFPAQSNPNASIERCGILQAGTNYSTNYILQHPADNAIPFHNTFCHRVSNSYNVNQKIVRPSGYGPMRIVEPGETITYRIDFQNTGTDTAYKVIVTDNVNNSWDITSLQLLSSSHSFTFKYENDMLTWLFDPILLPNSIVDEPNSHGYVEFSVRLISSVTQAVISNRASITFNQDNPIITNNVSIKICTPEIPSITIFPVSDYCDRKISFYYTTQFGGSAPQIEWYVNGSYYYTTSDTINFSNINYNYTISAVLASNSPCAISDSVVSNIFVVTGNIPTITYTWPNLIAPAASDYQWYLNGILLPGANGQNYIPSASGNYLVLITDSTGCSFLSSIFPFVYTNITSTNSSEIIVYPNPSQGKFMVETTSGKKSVSVINLIGRNLLQLQTTDKNFMIDLSDKYPSGIYYLIIQTGEKVYYERIVVQQ